MVFIIVLLTNPSVLIGRIFIGGHFEFLTFGNGISSEIVFIVLLSSVDVWIFFFGNLEKFWILEPFLFLYLTPYRSYINHWFFLCHLISSLQLVTALVLARGV